MNATELLAPHLADFSAEVRAFVRTRLPQPVREKVLRHEALSRAEQTAWQRQLVDRGWGAPAWPVEHGGTGWDALQRHVFGQVLTEEGAPEYLAFGQNMLAPVLMAVGTDAQKRELLPRILTLEDWWCQGFSEPGAGSDLAALSTRAERDGEHWVVTGQKTWISFAHLADRMFCLVRTDPAARRQAGITMLLVSMKSPGVTVRPILTLDGAHTVNDVFLDGVRVPVADTVGEPGQGWAHAKLLLTHERSGIARVGAARRDLQRLKSAVDAWEKTGALRHEAVSLRARVASIEIDLTALEVTSLRVLAGAPGGPTLGANLLKIAGSELTQRLTEMLLEVTGVQGLPSTFAHPDADEGHRRYAEARGRAQAFLRRRVVTIYGGSNEIQRNIVARAALGLKEAE